MGAARRHGRVPASAAAARRGPARHLPAARDAAAQLHQLLVVGRHQCCAPSHLCRAWQDLARVRAATSTRFAIIIVVVVVECRAASDNDRREGPDGALSASRYSCMGGFDGTSNVLAGQMFGLKISGTHAHAFVSSFSENDSLPDPSLVSHDGSTYVKRLRCAALRSIDG